MPNQNIERNKVRIPNLPTGAIVDSSGNPTSDEMLFRQALLSLLQKLVGNEGLVMPTQTAADITVIQNNQITTASGVPNQFTCAPGTFLYNSTNDTVQVSILVAGVPVFKTVTVT